MHSLNDLICLASFAGLSFWTCSFISEFLVGIFRRNSNSPSAVYKIFWTYIRGGLASILIFIGVTWLLVEVINFPVYLFSDISYTGVALLAIFCGTTTAIIKILFPNLFLQGIQKKEYDS